MTDFLLNTRDSYDAIAADYAEQHAGAVGEPFDRGLLAAFRELVTDGQVAELGSGPGQVTAYLRDLGLDAFGIDLSPQMVELARKAHPELRFEIGSMLALDLPDESLAGIVSWYALMHIPPAELPVAFAEFRRVLRPGGHLAIAAVAGSELVHRTEAFGREIALDYHLRDAETLAAAMNEVGLVAHTRVNRDPAGEENFPRAFLLATRP